MKRSSSGGTRIAIEAALSGDTSPLRIGDGTNVATARVVPAPCQRAEVHSRHTVCLVASRAALSWQRPATGVVIESSESLRDGVRQVAQRPCSLRMARTFAYTHATVGT